MRPAPDEIWRLRAEAIDGQMSVIVHTIPDTVVGMDDWDVRLLAVRVLDGSDLICEVDGVIRFG